MIARIGLLTLFFVLNRSVVADENSRPIREPVRLPGMQPSGLVLLPTQWSLKPAGKQIKVGDFPTTIALHPKEPFAAVLHCGYGTHEVVVLDLKSQKVVSQVTIPQAFYGLAFDPAGATLFASGCEYEVIHAFKFAGGYLSEHAELRIADVKERQVVAGMSVSADGKLLYAANVSGHSVAVVPRDVPAEDVKQKVRLLELPKESYPYTTLPAADGKRLFVSLWGQAAVAVVNLETGKVDAQWKTPSHPTEMLASADGSLLYVACANSNSVAVVDSATGESLEVISSALYPNAPNGSTPNSIALSPDGKVLLIANAENNNVAMIDVSERGHSRSLGFLPVGWYPTSVRWSPLDNRIYVANGKGLMSKANVQGPQPGKDPPATVREYIGGLYRGTVSAIDPPSLEVLGRYTHDAYECSPLMKDASPVVKQREANNPIPAKLGEKSPIKHCVYIIKENRTYDQVFGDIQVGNGDPDLCIFGDSITPNLHKLARDFVLLDNFYVESEVSADGHEWSMAAYATDFIEKTWPLNYRGGGDKLPYPGEDASDLAVPAGGYIWDRCAEAGVSYRSYGEWIENGKQPNDPGKASVKALEGHFDPMFRGYDLDYPDVKRAERFITELKKFEQQGELPRFIVMRLPNDHTYGTSPGKPTPTAMVADNDIAVAMVVDALSHSKFWPELAIFIVEDDAQNGSDHVDAHRTTAFVISPYCKRSHVDSSMYSTASMLRTMELILGLEPMSQFDAAALPMYASFQPEPNMEPYTRIENKTDLSAVNRPDAWGSQLSLKLDFSKEDAADDLLLNDIVWRSVRGPGSPMPPPVRAAFVFAIDGQAEEK